MIRPGSDTLTVAEGALPPYEALLELSNRKQAMLLVETTGLYPKVIHPMELSLESLLKHNSNRLNWHLHW